MWRICWDILFLYSVYQLVDGVPLNFRSFRLNPSMSLSPNATYNFSFKTPASSNPSAKTKNFDKEPGKIRINENEIRKGMSDEMSRNEEMYDSNRPEIDRKSNSEVFESYGNNRTQRTRLTSYSAMNISPKPDIFYSQRMSHDKYIPMNPKNYTMNFLIPSTTAKDSNLGIEKSYYKPQPSDYSPKPILSRLKLSNLLLHGPSVILANLESLTSTTQAPSMDQNRTAEETETSYQIKGKGTQERERINKLKREIPGSRKMSYNMRNGDSAIRWPCGPSINNSPMESEMEISEEMLGRRGQNQFKIRGIQMEGDNNRMISGEGVLPLQMTDREQKLHEMTDELVLDLHQIQQSEEYYPMSQSKRQHVLEMLEMHIKGIGAKKKLKRDYDRLQTKESESEQKMSFEDDSRTDEEGSCQSSYNNIYEESAVATEHSQMEESEPDEPDSSPEIVTSQYPSFLYNELSMIQNKYKNIVSHFLSQIRNDEKHDRVYSQEEIESDEPHSSENTFEYVRKFRSFKGPNGRLNIYDFI